MASPVNDYPKTDKEIASFWGTNLRTLYRWKSLGAPLRDYEQMLSWLSTRKNLPKVVIEKIAVLPQENVSSPVSNGGTAGAAQALKRLEASELQAFERMQSALASGNPLSVRESRESWLKISESLRRYDLMIEQSRRDAGELTPVSQVQMFITYFIAGAMAIMTRRAEDIVNETHGKDERTQYAALRDAFDETIVTGIIAYSRGSKVDQRLASFAKECVKGRYAHYRESGLFEFAEEFVRIIRDGK
jgi:hypothetical protein